jgi:hypothetical protein
LYLHRAAASRFSTAELRVELRDSLAKRDQEQAKLGFAQVFKVYPETEV